jgi:hypothetical protein
MMRPSEYFWPGVLGRPHGVPRGDPIEQELHSVSKKNGAKSVKELREATKSRGRV